MRIDAARAVSPARAGVHPSSAPYLATNEEPFTTFAVLHGGTFPGGFGPRHVRGWFSTGTVDPIRTPVMVRSAADATEHAGLDVEMRVFPGGHEMTTDERAAVVAWWLER